MQVVLVKQPAGGTIQWAYSKISFRGFRLVPDPAGQRGSPVGKLAFATPRSHLAGFGRRHHKQCAANVQPSANSGRMLTCMEKNVVNTKRCLELGQQNA